MSLLNRFSDGVTGWVLEKSFSWHSGGALNMRYRSALVLFFSFVWLLPAFGQWTPLTPVTSVTQDADGVRAVFQSRAVLKLQVCTGSVIHFLYSPTGKFAQQTNYVVTKTSWPAVAWKMESSEKNVTLTTRTLKVIIAN